jgi:predicted house-cleaning noncanonical NTP pyrophosphatase (MazG superfamily)
MNLGNLRRVNLPASTPTIDEDREELRTRGKEFFSGRSINWEKLGVINRVRSRFSTDYMKKVQDEFKNYLKEKLIRKMNEFKTFTYNNDLDKVRDYVRGIKDLSGSDLKELLSLVDAKEVEIANEYFVKERDILINKLIERGCLTAE